MFPLLLRCRRQQCWRRKEVVVWLEQQSQDTFQIRTACWGHSYVFSMKTVPGESLHYCGLKQEKKGACLTKFPQLTLFIIISFLSILHPPFLLCDGGGEQYSHMNKGLSSCTRQLHFCTLIRKNMTRWDSATKRQRRIMNITPIEAPSRLTSEDQNRI